MVANEDLTDKRPFSSAAAANQFIGSNPGYKHLLGLQTRPPICNAGRVQIFAGAAAQTAGWQEFIFKGVPQTKFTLSAIGWTEQVIWHEVAHYHWVGGGADHWYADYFAFKKMGML